MGNLSALQRALGVSFNNPSLLEQALVHSSYVNENPGLVAGSNERLEFLGDAILSLIVSEKIYGDLPQRSEGEMTRLRAAVVRRDALVRVAKTYGLGEHLYLGKGEESSGGRHKPANLAGAMEALVAAFFIDQGLANTTDFVLRLFNNEIGKALGQGIEIDYKSKLQELIQSRQQVTPTYRVIEAAGPDHDRKFTVEVKVDDAVLGKGSGKSKKMAETEAARSALQRLANGFTLR